MKIRKPIILITVITVIAIAVVIGVFNIPKFSNIITGGAHVKISFGAKNLDDLIKNSPLIIVAHVTDSQTQYKYSGVDFVNVQLEVKNVLKGSDFSETKITLLQTVCAEEPIVEKGSTVLLFLHKYIGPVTDNAYVCVGMYQGQYKLDGDTIQPSKNDNVNLTNDVKTIGNLNSLKNKINLLASEPSSSSTSINSSAIPDSISHDVSSAD
jgi:hypothetical protein